MKEYTVTYVDKDGDTKTFELMAANSRHAIDSTLELCTDCKRVTRCTIKPMFEDE
nr:hypothetical protein 29 [Pelagibacteraceae bacterium]